MASYDNFYPAILTGGNFKVSADLNLANAPIIQTFDTIKQPRHTAGPSADMLVQDNHGKCCKYRVANWCLTCGLQIW